MTRGTGGGWAAALLFVAACTTTTTGPKDEVEPELLDRAANDLLSENYSSAAFKYEQYLFKNPQTPKRPWVTAQIGLCRNGAGDYEGAIRNFNASLPGADPALRLQILYRRAIANNYLERPETALTDLQEIAAAPKDVRERSVKTTEFLRIFGVTQIRAGLWTGGQKTLKELLDRFPQSQEASVVKPMLLLKTFTVQLAGCPDEKSANAKVAEFKSKGLTPRALTLPDRVVVVTGEFARFSDAVRERARIKALGFDGFILP